MDYLACVNKAKNLLFTGDFQVNLQIGTGYDWYYVMYNGEIVASMAHGQYDRSDGSELAIEDTELYYSLDDYNRNILDRAIELFDLIKLG